MNGILDQAVERFKTRPEEEREAVKTLLVNFRNMYAFLSQVIPYQDTGLEQLYTYLRFLLTKLPKREDEPGYHLEDEVELQYYRLQKISEGQIDLSTGDGKPLKGPSDVGTGQEDQQILLSELIDILNERFGTNFTQADQLFFDQLEATWLGDEQLVAQARANPIENFRLVFSDAFIKSIVGRMDDNADIFGKILVRLSGIAGSIATFAMLAMINTVYPASMAHYLERFTQAFATPGQAMPRSKRLPVRSVMLWPPFQLASTTPATGGLKLKV